jgi:hypothetical protein
LAHRSRFTTPRHSEFNSIPRVNQLQGQRIRLAMPLNDAIAFALGVSDLGYKGPGDATRQVIGSLAIDKLQYSEQWRDSRSAPAKSAREMARFPRLEDLTSDRTDFIAVSDWSNRASGTRRGKFKATAVRTSDTMVRPHGLA